MATFKFRLERILRLRETMEERAMYTWGERMAKLHESKEQLEELFHLKEDVRKFGYKQHDLRLRQAMYSYLAVLDKKIAAQTELVKERELLAEKARNAWFSARKETKKVTILRDKEYAHFVKEKQSKEQKELDDMRPYVQE
ncbi:MAG TPA: hypothetical protein GX521_00535 [Firmicutes bacterium]|nr:hypothetical protein [Bacillota bacterium]